VKNDMKALIGFLMIVLACCISLGGAVIIHFTITIPANIAYDQAFGSDINLMTEGSASLVGYQGNDQGSMHFYLMHLWATMNSTWGDRNFKTTYANEANFWLGTLGARVPHNTLAATNQYFESLNSTLYQKQELIDQGKVIGSGDPMQAMVNNTREEINAYGGIDWVLHDLYMHDFQSAAYWSPVTMITLLIISLTLAIVGIILFLYGIEID
jgi:hypothetical protein